METTDEATLESQQPTVAPPREPRARSLGALLLGISGSLLFFVCAYFVGRDTSSEIAMHPWMADGFASERAWGLLGLAVTPVVCVLAMRRLKWPWRSFGIGTAIGATMLALLGIGLVLGQCGEEVQRKVDNIGRF